jgi:hypothetical protein
LLLFFYVMQYVVLAQHKYKICCTGTHKYKICCIGTTQVQNKMCDSRLNFFLILQSNCNTSNSNRWNSFLYAFKLYFCCKGKEYHYTFLLAWHTCILAPVFMGQKNQTLLHKKHDKERLWKKHKSKSLSKPNVQIISIYIYIYTLTHTHIYIYPHVRVYACMHTPFGTFVCWNTSF